MTTTCTVCGKEIRVGDDCYAVAQGVMGTRDFIDLSRTLYCSAACLDLLVVRTADEGDKSGIPGHRRVP